MKRFVISSAPSMVLAHYVRIIMVCFSSIPKLSAESSVRSYVKLGRMVIKTTALSTHQPPRMWRNTLMAILVCLKFYSLNIRSRSTSSKNPCIGYCKDDEKEVFKNFLTGTYGYNKFDKDSQQFYFVAPPSYVENRYFPKCRGFSSLSYFEKLRIYSYAYDLTKDQQIDRSIVGKLVSSQFDSGVDRHATFACLRYCNISGITPADYVRNLERYYSSKELYQLGLHYTYQQSYIDEYHLPISNLLSFDLTSYERIPYYKHDFNTSPLRDIYLSYGVDSRFLYDSYGIIVPQYVESLKQENTDFYRKNVLFNQKVHTDSLKTKTLNESINPLIFTNLN